LIDQLGCSDGEAGRAPRHHRAIAPVAAPVAVAEALPAPERLLAAGPLATRQRSRHRSDGGSGRLPSPRSSTSRTGSTITMLAVSAVGAGTAMTGTFAAITDATTQDSPDVLAAQPVVMDDVLVPATSPSPAAAATVLSSSPVGTTQPVAAQQRVSDDHPAALTMLGEDTLQTDARDIAALARSVDREKSATPAVSSPVAGLGLGGALNLASGPVGDLVPGAAMRSTAMNAALSKLGVPYVWGAAGPKAFDCSGLVLWAFNKVGISMPHSSRAQSQMGKPVSKSQLRPGDLVFFYTPVSHVGIYIGNGKIVHASESGQPVKISNLNRFPFHNARRL
jgi:cell wall-associated NlpC family hydrolase